MNDASDDTMNKQDMIKMPVHDLSDDELVRYARQILLNDWDMDVQL